MTENSAREESGAVGFAFEYTVEGMRLSQSQPIRFDVRKPYPLAVVLSKKNMRGVEAEDAHFFLTVLINRRPNTDVLHFLGDASQTKNPERPESGTFKVDPHGKVRGIYYTDKTGCPESYETFVAQLHQEAFDAASAILSLARWRVDAHGPHQPVMELCSSCFTLDGTIFHSMQLQGHSFWDMQRDLSVSEQQKQQIIEYFEQGVREPFSHRLFREAWNQRLRSPRSALIAGVAALEIGIKDTLADLIPDAEWLVLNQPSPDIVQILRDGIPKFPARLTIGNKVVSPPKRVLDELRKAVQMRNKLAHAGQGKVHRETVHDILCTIRDVLSLLDYYRGHEWALCHVSDAMLAELPGLDVSEFRDRTKGEDEAQSPTATVVAQLSDLPDRID